MSFDGKEIWPAKVRLVDVCIPLIAARLNSRKQEAQMQVDIFVIIGGGLDHDDQLITGRCSLERKEEKRKEAQKHPVRLACPNAFVIH